MLKATIKKLPGFHTINHYRKRMRIALLAYYLWIRYKENPPLFSSIEIETVNRCNMTCPFCPVNKSADKREYKKMDESTFNKIVGELKSLEYAGAISLFSNNEPFLDERIETFSETLKNALPKAYIYLYTNATVLTLERFKAVMPHLDRLVIDNYSDDNRMIKTVQAIADYLDGRDGAERKKVTIKMRKKNEVLSTRGGQSPNNNKKETLHTSCLLPWNQLIIRPDGKISLCCQDAYGIYTLGDVTKQTLQEIWYSKARHEIRKRIVFGRRGRLCEYCDVLDNPFMEVPTNKNHKIAHW